MAREHVNYAQWNINLKKKNEIIPFAAIWMDLERIVLTEGNQSKKKDRCHYDITYMWDLNKMKETNEL